MPFIDREREMAFLQSEYDRSGSALVVLYGRRRVGKTTLIKAFIHDKPAVYFLATEESEKQNRQAFKDIIAHYTNNNLLQQAVLDRWEPIFQALLDFRTDRKKVIILDEFQYLGKSEPAFPSIFQKIWDSILKDQSVMVILCGSLITMMESQTLNYNSPLYGRRTGQIRLKQILFEHFQAFYPGKTRRELIEYYAITGGVPKYIELFDHSADIFSAIQYNILDKSSFLFDEPYFLLQREVNEVGSYFNLIRTIAAGNQKLSKIAGNLELKQTGLTKYLRTLINLDILEREVPVTEDNPETSKRGLYKIKDNFLRFWFLFILPNISYIESGHEELAMQKIRQNLVTNHISYVYEDVCLEKMWQLNAENQWDFHFDHVGRWWDGNNKIDIVALDRSGKDIIFGECKFCESKIGINILSSLEKKTESVIWKNTIRQNHYILFSISGFTDELIAYAKTRPDLLLCD